MAQLTFISPGTLEWAIVQLKKGSPVMRRDHPKFRIRKETLDKPGSMIAFGKDSIFATDWIIDESSSIVGLDGNKPVFDNKKFGVVTVDFPEEKANAT